MEFCSREEIHVDCCDTSQGFKITRPGGFEMYQAAGLAHGGRVDAEFVRAGVQAEFVWAKVTGDSSMPGQVGFEGRLHRRYSPRPFRNDRCNAAPG